MLRNVIAIRRDGFDVQQIAILFEVPDQDFDLKAAVVSAATDYVKTPEGRKIYEGNCSEMNWSDFAWIVPNEFCEKHGFRKVDSGVLPDIIVNWDMNLVDDSQLSDDNNESEEN
jgi:hypothetical protein